jgi:hypothetical protein
MIVGRMKVEWSAGGLLSGKYRVRNLVEGIVRDRNGCEARLKGFLVNCLEYFFSLLFLFANKISSTVCNVLKFCFNSLAA